MLEIWKCKNGHYQFELALGGTRELEDGSIARICGHCNKWAVKDRELKVPPGWRLMETRDDGHMWYNAKKKMSVIASIDIEKDGHSWLHLSIAHRMRIPTYEALVYLKRHWAGADKKCIQVFPVTEEHVNIHPNCLHLFCCLSGDPIPDFTQGTGLI